MLNKCVSRIFFDATGTYSAVVDGSAVRVSVTEMLINGQLATVACAVGRDALDTLPDAKTRSELYRLVTRFHNRETINFPVFLE